jgi:hypothetical protein
VEIPEARRARCAKLAAGLGAFVHPYREDSVKLRSITVFGEPGHRSGWRALGEGLRHARHAFQERGFEVQTVRAALPPMARLASGAAELVDHAREMESRAREHEIEYISLGPWRPEDPRAIGEAIPDLLRATTSVFATVRLDDGGRISVPAARLAADCIVRNAPLEENGFANLRFAALARVPAGVPFLPAAYADSQTPSFALALECADLARESFAEGTLDESTQRLCARVEATAHALETVAHRVAEDLGWPYRGADFSLAPYPDDRNSIGACLESMGVEATGRPGTVVGAALLTSALQQADFERAGFNGLFLPVLEDATLAARASSGDLRLEDLLLASTVCGTGLDTVPLPGDVEAEELLPHLLDLATLALRLDKALTARLMPMPGLAAGDGLDFDFPFFAPGRVMDLRRHRLGPRMAEASWISVPRRDTPPL